MNPEKLKQMQEQVRIGGKGTVRRKKKVTNREHLSDDRKIQATLKKIGLSEIPCIDEVQMFKSDCEIIHFTNPKLLAMPSANTFAIQGPSEIKTVEDMWPSLLNQLRMGGLTNLLRKFPEFPELPKTLTAVAGADNDCLDDDSIPELVESFETSACD